MKKRIGCGNVRVDRYSVYVNNFFYCENCVYKDKNVDCSWFVIENGLKEIWINTEDE